MSALSSQFALVVAQTELKLVESLIAAVRAGDTAAARSAQPLGGAKPTPQARQVVHPEPKIEPRQIFHQAPLYEPAAVIHLSPRVESASQFPAAPYDSMPHPSHDLGALPPPWRMPLPVPAPTYYPSRFKREHPQPDMLIKGLLIDIFI